MCHIDKKFRYCDHDQPAECKPIDHAEELNRATSAHIQNQQLRQGLANGGPMRLPGSGPSPLSILAYRH